MALPSLFARTVRALVPFAVRVTVAPGSVVTVTARGAVGSAVRVALWSCAMTTPAGSAATTVVGVVLLALLFVMVAAWAGAAGPARNAVPISSAPATAPILVFMALSLVVRFLAYVVVVTSTRRHLNQVRTSCDQTSTGVLIFSV